ncbi:hypothetical protein BCR35DRAFT_306686 [Leucosporidium creatinivorum]|uniref:histidine kinase n=1 Tax=Leucosporidium creatinivorum TaxID=106004 RepID=A0A1Y2ETA5_9BASI|nr:hypothetical protein BCR35DRAFT_306686 [Leucosporidium creatinivorum]
MTQPLPPSSSRSRPSSPAPRGEDLVFVHTSTNATSPIPSSRSSKSSSSFGSSSRGRPHSKGSSSSRNDNNRSFDDWMTAYAANKLGLRPDQVPAPPPAILAILEEEKETRSSSPASNDSGDVMYLYSNRSSHSVNSVHSEEPPSALDRFRQLGHLQAPAPPFEQERLKLASKFGLEQPRRRAALDSICKLAKRHFSMKTVVISLTFEDHQVLAGEVGWGGKEPGPDEPPRPLTLAPAMCTHALISAPDPTSPDSSTFIVGNANEDWRFSKNPYTTGMGGGLAYYAAANVMLEVDEKDQLEKDLPPSLPVGAICLIDDQPRDPAAFTDEDRSMLREFANMIARELTLGHEQRRRDAETRQSDFLGTFLNSALVLPDKAPATTAQTPSAPPQPNLHPSTPDNPRFPSVPGANASPATHAIFAPIIALGDSPTTTFALAAEKLHGLTDAESAAIFDLRSFRAPISQDSPELHAEAQQQRRRNASFSRDLGGQGKLYLMGSSGNVDWEGIAGKEQLLGVVNDALTEYDASATVIFDSSSRVQPLGAVLPPSVSSTICLPLFDVDGTPALLIILTSTVKHFTFIESDVRFSRNVGAITMGYLLRQRAEQADRAKLAFVSQISHELRTPLHGINSQVELIREFSTPGQLRRLAPLLDTAEVCLESLRDVLDDTLDFAKLTSSSTSEEERQRAHARAVTPTNLEQLLEDVSKATWVRKKRTDLVTADVGTPKDGSAQQPRTPSPQVDLILEVENRAAGWTGLFDLGATKRVLLNLLGNALKFTQHGHVKLSLRELPRPRCSAEENVTTIRLDIEDTGIGMSEDFLRNKLFTPFVQENSFANGAGLGMSICQTIVHRMGGEISVRSVHGQGTKISITLPVEMLAEDPQPPTPFTLSSTTTPTSSAFPTPGATNGNPPAPFRTRIISQELATIFNPGPAHLVLSSSPRSEIKALDFSQAVEAAAASKTLVRMPSARRPRRGSVLGRRGDQEDIVVEAAKLGYATVLAGEEGDPSGTKLAKEIAASMPKEKKEKVRKVRVLVADDNPIARNIFTKLFTVKGIPFEQAENGKEAVDLFKAAHAAGNPFHLVCTDVQMPVMDGLEAAWAIRQHESELDTPSRCRLIALTGLSNEEDLRNAADGPLDYWVVKGGKSMRAILEEIARLQQELDSADV